MHIYRQEEKELVKHLFKLQQEKQRRHPEIDSARRHTIDVPDTEYLVRIIKTSIIYFCNPNNQQ